jgi:hypothetical protein
VGLDAATPNRNDFLTTREAKTLGPIGNWLLLHSHAARCVLSRVVQRIRANHGVVWSDVYKGNGHHEKDWLKVEAELSRMFGLAKANGARLVVLHIPTRP